MSKKLLVFLAGMMIASLVFAQPVYKWVDSKGKVHYGDNPTSTKPKLVDTKSQMKGADSKAVSKCPYAK